MGGLPINFYEQNENICGYNIVHRRKFAMSHHRSKRPKSAKNYRKKKQQSTTQKRRRGGDPLAEQQLPVASPVNAQQPTKTWSEWFSSFWGPTKPAAEQQQPPAAAINGV